MERPPTPSTTRAATARRVVLGFGVREIGIATIALGLLCAGGLWLRARLSARATDLDAVRHELAVRLDAAEVCQERVAALRAEVAEVRAWADAQADEPLRSWARERMKRMEALLAAVDRGSAAEAFRRGTKDVLALCARGEAVAAAAKLSQLPAPRFPPPSEFQAMREHLYLRPLAAFSRQNPRFYRALRQYEAEAAREDETALRAEIATAGAEGITPQRMLKVELLAAVAAADDPVVAEWASLTSALDYFEEPDEPTLNRWRRAQQAVRAQDWPAAAAEMQAIQKSRVRTRQPFRAALGRALLRSRPDAVAEAYPLLAEAAAAGDRQARAWVAEQDVRQQRYAQAQRWFEAQAADGEMDAVPRIVEAYRDPAAAQTLDPGRQMGVLERVTERADAPADAWLLLGQLYERDDRPGVRAKAFACYTQAAAKGSGRGSLEVARCALAGSGTPPNPDQARDAACAAFTRGEREPAAEVLLELMRRSPERCVGAVTRMFENEAVAGGGGYMETRTVDGPGVMQLKSALARYLDQQGRFGQAARFYAGLRDAAAARRHAELTAAHPCETCGGSGKVLVSSACPTCGGKGTQICTFCGGNGIIYAPGAPPCASCGGTGTMIQDRKVVACSTCNGSGKGKGSVVKQDCPHCEGGHVRCVACTGGVVQLTRECPDCHGRGAWTLAGKE